MTVGDRRVVENGVTKGSNRSMTMRRGIVTVQVCGRIPASVVATRLEVAAAIADKYPPRPEKVSKWTRDDVTAEGRFREVRNNQRSQKKKNAV